MIRKLKMLLAQRKQRKAMEGFEGCIVGMSKANQHLIDEKARIIREIAEKEARQEGYGTQIESNQGIVDAMSSVLNGLVKKA